MTYRTVARVIQFDGLTLAFLCGQNCFSEVNDGFCSIHNDYECNTLQTCFESY